MGSGPTLETSFHLHPLFKDACIKTQSYSEVLGFRTSRCDSGWGQSSVSNSPVMEHIQRLQGLQCGPWQGWGPSLALQRVDLLKTSKELGIQWEMKPKCSWHGSETTVQVFTDSFRRLMMLFLGVHHQGGPELPNGRSLCDLRGPVCQFRASQVAQPASAGDVGLIPGPGRSSGGRNGNPLQYSSWRILWTEEPDGLQCMESQRIKTQLCIHTLRASPTLAHNETIPDFGYLGYIKPHLCYYV